MTRIDRERLQVAVSRAAERREVREALAASTATEAIGRRLGDELISAARELIDAWHAPIESVAPMARRFIEVDRLRIERAVARLIDLVGRP
jgi:hypothetical protein